MPPREKDPATLRLAFEDHAAIFTIAPASWPISACRNESAARCAVPIVGGMCPTGSPRRRSWGGHGADPAYRPEVVLKLTFLVITDPKGAVRRHEMLTIGAKHGLTQHVPRLCGRRGSGDHPRVAMARAGAILGLGQSSAAPAAVQKLGRLGRRLV